MRNITLIAHPSPVEFKNLLACEEVITKQMRNITLQIKEEVLYASESLSNNKLRGYKNSDKGRSDQRTTQPV